MAGIGGDINVGVFEMRMNLHQCVLNGVFGQEVLNHLIVDGDLVPFERQLWDYKSKLPIASTKIKPTEEEKQNFDAELCEIIKDAVSFYNSYGGYLIAGVTDNEKIIEGWTGAFNSDELNKRIKAYTKHDIETHFTSVKCEIKGKLYSIGILFIPQRPDTIDVAQFQKDAVSSVNGKKAFLKGQFYFRSNDECKPAAGPEDFSFLCSAGRRRFTLAEGRHINSLSDNLGPRDPGFIEFVGRDEYLKKLWEWLLDKYVPVKLLAGIGGVGKTAIAREFAEIISRMPPAGFSKIIWLSAKKQYFTAVMGKYSPATRIDFDDVPSLLKALLLELTASEHDLPDADDRDGLMEQTIEALNILPSLIIIDDIDSLEADEQQDVFHTVIQILTQTINSPHRASRAILTARLDLGAAPSQVFRVKGLEQPEFEIFTKMTCESLSLPESVLKNSKFLKKFRDDTNGSPTFCSSILRLVSMGENIDQALTKWKGADGEDVRNFAFKKEVDQLSDPDARVFYAVMVLGDATLTELTIILKSNETAVRDSIGTLRNYHLVSMGEAELPGGTKIHVPSDIRLMRNIVKDRVGNFSQIELECARIRKKQATVSTSTQLGATINRVVTLWETGQMDEARDFVIHSLRSQKDNPELQCLLGRSHMLTEPQNFAEADKSFRIAKQGGCGRSELEPLWIEAKIALGDWQGVLEITENLSKFVTPADRLFFRANAYQQLAKNATALSDYASAVSLLRLGADELADGFTKNKAKGRVEELKALKIDLFTRLIELLSQTTSDPNNFLDIWLAVVSSYKAYVRSSRLMRLGVAKLVGWWHAVERRERFDASTESLGRAQVTILLGIIGAESDPMQKDYLSSAVSELDSRIAIYSDTIN